MHLINYLHTNYLDMLKTLKNLQGELSLGIMHLVRMQKFPKNVLIQKRTCAYQGVRNVSFFGKFCVRTKWIIPKHF